MPGTLYCAVQLLQRGHDQFRIITQSLHQRPGVVGPVHALFLEAVELYDGLVIQIFPVYNKQDLMNARCPGQDLCRLE